MHMEKMSIRVNIWQMSKHINSYKFNNNKDYKNKRKNKKKQN